MGLPIVPSGKCWQSKINWRALPRSGPKLFAGSAVEPAWAQGFSLLQQCWAALELLLVLPIRVVGPQSFCQVFCSIYSDVNFLFDRSSQASSCSFSRSCGWEPVVLMALSDVLGKVESLQCCFSLIQGPGWLWNVDEVLVAPPALPCIGYLVLPTGGARASEVFRKLPCWEGQVWMIWSHKLLWKWSCSGTCCQRVLVPQEDGLQASPVVPGNMGK